MRRIRQGLLAALPLAIGVLIAAVVAGGGPSAEARHCRTNNEAENEEGGGGGDTTPPTEIDLRSSTAPTGTVARRGCRHNDDDDDDEQDERAELTVIQTAAPDPIRAGDFLTYTITVRNGGSVTAGAVQVVMSLGAGGQIASSQLPGNCTSGGGSAICQLGSLGDGASASVQIVVIPSVAGVLTNQVTATSSDASGQATTGGAVTVQSFMPTQGVNFGAIVTSGVIYIQLPGNNNFQLLGQNQLLPSGSIINANNGSIQIITSNLSILPSARRASRGRVPTAGASAVSRAEFSGGTFRVTQDRSPNAATDLKLVGGDFGSCPRGLTSRLAAGPDAHAAAAPSRRRLWGRGRGRFRTRGRYGAATVRGTHWLTVDRCDGTLFVAREGSLTVRDLVRRRTLTLRAPRSHLVRAPIRER